MQIGAQRRLVANVPWGLAVATLLLALMGIYNLASASKGLPTPVWKPQAAYLLIGVVVVVVVTWVDYRLIQRLTVPIFIINLALLLALKFFGHKAKGAQSWFDLGFVRVQPAEFMKIGMVLMLAKWFHDDFKPTETSYGFLRLIIPSALALVPILMVLAQPDLGTALMMVFTAATLILFARIRWTVVVTLAVVGVLGIGVLWNDYARPPGELVAVVPAPAGIDLPKAETSPEMALADWGLEQSQRQPEPHPEGKKLEEVVVVTENVLAGSQPWADWLSWLHVRSMKGMVRREVTLTEGEAWSPERAAETERKLRGQPIFAAARVVPVKGKQGGVAALVIAKDRFTHPRITVVRHLLKKHQDDRIAGWIDPQHDLKGTNYHSNQSKIAVGSGGVWGKGWNQGTQTALRYLPEQHTDFIFSVWAEEHGFFMCLFLLGLYGLLLLSALFVAFNAKDRFGAFVAVGIAAMIFWQVFENVGMVTGLLPVTGITLPLLSYGGSSMLSVMLGIGLLVNIGMRRHIF